MIMIHLLEPGKYIFLILFFINLFCVCLSLLFKSKLDKLKNLEDALDKAKDVEEDSERFKEYCDDYVMDKTGDNEHLNRRINTEPLLNFWIQHDRTPDLHNDIIDQILGQSNIIIYIFGPTGEGKSEILQYLMKYWKRSFKKLKNKDVNPDGLLNYITFSDSQLGSIFLKIKDGYICGRDENSDQEGSGTTTDKKRLRNIAKQTRAAQTSLIFASAEDNIEDIKVPGVDYYLEVCGKNKKTRTTRCIWYDRRGIPMGFVYITLHDDKEFRKKYNIRKNENIAGLLGSGGQKLSMPDQERMLRHCVNLYEFCYNKDVRYLTDVEAQLNNYNMQFDPQKEADKLIGGPNYYVDHIKKNVLWALTGELEKVFDSFREYILHRDKEKQELIEETIKEEEEIALQEMKERKTKTGSIPAELDIEKLGLDEFSCTEEKIFQLIRKNVGWRNKERDIEIYYAVKRGRTTVELAEAQVWPLKQNSISTIYNKVLGAIWKYKGKLHEDFVAKKLRESTYFKKVVKDAGVGESDILAYTKEDKLYILSLKNLKIKDPEEHYYYIDVKEEVRPELKESLLLEQDQETHLYLLVYDSYHNKCMPPIEIDFHNPPKTINLMKYVSLE